MAPFLSSNMEKSKHWEKQIRYILPSPAASTQAGGAELVARWGLPTCFALYLLPKTVNTTPRMAGMG